MDKPRYTLLITCYNFEKFIREAVEGALAQTYEPLDIIISDDCSTDRSWEVIQETVAAYKGPHHVILNHNEKNLGFAANLNKSFGMARTDWVLNQSGDDISLPTRVEEYARLIESNPKLRCVGALYEEMDVNGKVRPPQHDQTMAAKNALGFIPVIIGVVAAYHMDVFRVFGPLGGQVWNEDSVLVLRAKLIGEVGFVEKVLVRYRFHDANMGGGKADDMKRHLAYLNNRRLPLFYQWMTDLYVAEKLYPERGAEFLRMRRLIEDGVYIKWFTSNWTLHPAWRVRLLCDLLFSVSHCRAFLMKLLRKLVGRA